MEALFADKDDTHKVRALHGHFDRDKDGFLNHSELRGLQLLTSGNDMSREQYVLVCKSLACDPNKGLCVNALKVVYAAEGTDIDEDYAKVCPTVETKTHGGEDDVIEVGENGVDISG